MNRPANEGCKRSIKHSRSIHPAPSSTAAVGCVLSMQGQHQQQQPHGTFAGTAQSNAATAPFAGAASSWPAQTDGAKQDLLDLLTDSLETPTAAVLPASHAMAPPSAAATAAAANSTTTAAAVGRAGAGTQYHSGGIADLIVFGEEEQEDHPMDPPPGTDATLMLAQQQSSLTAARGDIASAAAAAAGPGGGRSRDKLEQVVGVHGGDGHLPEDEQTRTVQIQTLGGEGVLTAWQRFLKAAGVRRRRPRGAFVSNELVTSKYSLLSFIPVNLYHQFKRVANMYFLGLVCLQAIPGLSPVPWWGTLFPLAVVLAVNGVKEAFDDYFRHKSDEQVNHRWVTTLKEDGDQLIHWKALQVGDLVRLSNNEDVPADTVLLASSDPEGLCYVETANLDGETNLKAKFCHKATAQYDCAEAFSRAGYFTIECEAPNPRLYSFEGAICCWDFPPTYSPGLRGIKGSAMQGSGLGTSPWSQNGSRSNTIVNRALQEIEIEMTNGIATPPQAAGSGWYNSDREEEQQQHQQRSRSNSPSRRQRQQQQHAAAADVAGDSITASLGEYGQQVGLVYREPLSASSLLLRGCTVRKTEWVIGAVVFTGPDTKVVRNMLPAPRKVTRLETAMNRVVVVVLCALGSIAVVLASGSMAWEARHPPSRDWYLGIQPGWPELPPGVGAWFVQVVRFIILMAQAVPISLYVSLETVKVAQCKLLYDSDRLMYYAPEDVPCTSRTTTLNEELGQVQYVLSDKTGTLTQNIMGFVWASVAGRLYGQKQHAAQQAQPAHQAGVDAVSVQQEALSGSGGGTAVGGKGQIRTPHNTPHTIALNPDMRAAAAAAGIGCSSSGDAGVVADSGGAAVGEFLLALALCNTVVPTVTEQGQLLYQAASPDEEALVAGAAYLGTKLVSRSSGGIEVEVNGQLMAFELLAVLEFTSDRKRMSVVVRRPDGQLQLTTKGADNVMLARLTGGDLPAVQQASVQSLLPATKHHLDEMSSAGYRTLVVASKPLQQGEYAAWANRYREACASLVDRTGRVEAVCEELERGLMLLGATAVEDKLQEGVPEAIATLAAAGIKVWVLTGDKMETAVSIGHTARLLNSDMTVVKVTEADLSAGSHPRGSVQQSPAAANEVAGQAWGSSGAGSRDQQVAMALQRLAAQVNSARAAAAPAENGRILNSQTAATAAGNAATIGFGLSGAAASVSVGHAGAGQLNHRQVGLVIDGAALALALQQQHEDILLAICEQCAAVICCRVSPMQKAQVATLLKHKAHAVTLAIGDGANDVSMIQAAHIGVGISGREGRAAVQAADFAFGQFRFLVRLLLVHGRQSYLRCREVVLYAFYKNCAYVSCFLWFSAYSGLSSQTIFFPLYIATFNSIWTAFPTLGYGLFEQDVPAHVALGNPQLYDETRCETSRQFYQAWAWWMLLGVWHGVICFHIPLRVFSQMLDGADQLTTVDVLGTAVMTAVIFTVTLRVAIRTTHWTVVNHALIWGTLLAWIPFLAVLQSLCGAVTGLAPLCGLGPELLGSGVYWLGAVIGAPVLALLLDYTVIVFQRQFKPTTSQLLQESEAVMKRAWRANLSPIAGAAIEAVGSQRQIQGLQLPRHGPDIQQQLRQQQQQQQPSAPAASSHAGIIAVAHAASGNFDAGSSTAGSDGNLGLLGQQPGSAWQGRDGFATFGLGADHNLGGPHTLGDMAAAVAAGPGQPAWTGMEWAPDYITASPATLAASHTKRQHKAPLGKLRLLSADWSNAPSQMLPTSSSRGATSATTAAAAQANAGLHSSSSIATSGTRTQTVQQQQLQPGLQAGNGARVHQASRLGAQRRQQQQFAGPQFTLGGDDTL